MPADGIDPRFRQMGSSAKRRRRRAAWLRWGMAGGALAAVGGLGWHLAPADPGWLRGGDMAETLVQVEDGFGIAPVVRADTFTDIPGDPLIIPPPDDGAASGARQMPVPASLSADPRLRGQAAPLTVLEGSLMPRDRQLVASLPSTREEFAMFQAERSRARLAGSAGPGDPADQRSTSTSSVSFLRDADARTGLWRDLIVEAARPLPLADLLAGNGFAAPDAARLADRIAAQLSLDGDLAQGSVLALRYRLRGGGREVIQASLYNPGGYVGSLALSAAGQLVPAADPWVDQPLLDATMARGGGAPAGRQRLLDLIYSAALRNDIRPEIAGEVIAMMAKVQDLDSLADPEDRLTIIQGGDGAILFIGISGPGGDRPCYVVPEGAGFACHAPLARVQSAPGQTPLSPPVIGVLTQRFVPAVADRDDPRRGRVAWSAPEGTPVMAAAAGRISARRTGPDGASIEITHDGGLVSRYSGLGALSATAAAADSVAAGTAIGTVGRGAGGDAVLVFQVLQDGAPVDPMPRLGGVGAVLASNAVEALIGRIITVESAGNARAQNPLSTATGLGQFIESTWLRMIRSYRPDMAGGLDRAALLDLRFDPELSRQMVRHLAQENEAFLRARGHDVTPGRLYLAHFLGPAGADMVLRADPAALVAQVMGPAVVGANPFLRGYSIADLRHWADRKMAGASGADQPAPDISVPAEIRAYVDAVDSLRQAAQGG